MNQQPTPGTGGLWSATIAELRRRRVLRVMAAYGAAAWVLVEVTATTFPMLGLPEWAPRLVLVLLLAFFPIVLVLAWAFDVTSEGIRRTAPKEGRAPSRSSIGYAPLVLAALLGVVVGASGWHLARSDDAGEAGGGGEAPSGADAALAAEEGEGGGNSAVGGIRVATEPPGAEVTLTGVDPVEGVEGQVPAARGRTPLEARLPAGEYLLRLTGERVTPVLTVVEMSDGADTAVHHRLVSEGDLTRGMVRVPAGPSPVAEARPAEVAGFLIDRHEVTSRRYMEFVSADGYERAELWPDSMWVQREWLPGAEAAAVFVDRTGMPGPRDWSGGLYARGRGDHPVTGVSWYEAEAYCAWAGRALPDWHQWWRAAYGDYPRRFPWGERGDGDLRANFSLEGTRPVGSHPLGAGPSGALDLAGNVSEWIRRASDDDRFRTAVGGSWRTPSYMSEPTQAERLPAGHASDALGFRCARTLPGGSR